MATATKSDPVRKALSTELRAMGVLERTLDKLPAEAQARILRWAIERYVGREPATPLFGKDHTNGQD